MSFKVTSTLSKKESAKKLSNNKSHVVVYNKDSHKKALSLIGVKLSAWELREAKAENRSSLSGKNGPIKLVKINPSNVNAHQGLLSESEYANAREKMGALTSSLLCEKSKEITIDFLGVSEDVILGSIVGLELALYRYQGNEKLGVVNFKLNGKKLASKLIAKAKSMAVAINQARHLVNLPPNELNPVSYADEVKAMFDGSKTIKVKVLNEKQLEKEGCSLILGVGMSSNKPPRVVHLQYRGGKKGEAGIAYIGKGVTFDTGGTDIKPSAGMRLMKKDMGGSAALVGFARWLETSKVEENIDIYLGLAENAVSERAQRPSDVLKSRAGLTVEIDNTDAEGRLVMASCMSLALDLKPKIMIDVATLTGAGKIAVGQDINSLLSNDDELADKMLQAGNRFGDPNWRLPLYTPYLTQLKSDFADVSNCGSRWGGTITAALFLEKFVGKTKWAHFDIFGWTTSARPSLAQKGGSGQAVETLIGYFDC